jgi:1,2-phenylacetyl-CoA epoxidase PaaB subunit
MYKANLDKTHMIVHALEMVTDPFTPREDGEEYWVLNSHTLVTSMLLCTYQITLDLTLHLWSIYL